jgi:hypothetical protein
VEEGYGFSHDTETRYVYSYSSTAKQSYKNAKTMSQVPA